LSFNKIKKIEKDSLRELKLLEEIKLQNNELVELDTQLFRGLNKLEIIYLYYNKLNNNLDNKFKCSACSIIQLFFTSTICASANRARIH